VIRWIRPNLGTAPWLDATGAPDIRIVDVRDAIDGRGNGAAIVASKLNEALAALRAGERVIVCCDHGISRSNAIAAGVLARWEDRPFYEAVRLVMDATGEGEIKIEVLAAVRRAVETETVVARPRGERRVLITGATGDLGGAVRAEIGAFATVFTPDRREIDLLRGPTALDLFAKAHDVTDLVHLASPRIRNIDSALGDSLTMLRTAASVCCENGIFLVFPAGIDVFGGYRCEGLRADEALPPLPKGIRGETDFLGEVLLAQYRFRRGLECGIARFATTYGGDGPKPYFLNGFIEKARSGREIVTHRYENGPPALDLLHRDDAARGIAMLLEARLPEVFHFGSGETISTPELAERTAGWLQSGSPRSEIAVLDRTGTVAMDTAKAKARLGWEPRILPEVGLREYVLRRAATAPATA